MHLFYMLLAKGPPPNHLIPWRKSKNVAVQPQHCREQLTSHLVGWMMEDVVVAPEVFCVFILLLSPWFWDYADQIYARLKAFLSVLKPNIKTSPRSSQVELYTDWLQIQWPLGTSRGQPSSTQLSAEWFTPLRVDFYNHKPDTTGPHMQ